MTEKKGGDYEEAACDRAGGEGDSSRAHSIPHGTGNHQLHGTRAVLKVKCWKVKSPLLQYLLQERVILQHNMLD